MRPRPFYRWKSFWLGLFVLVFLGWAWVRSHHYREELAFSHEAIPTMKLVNDEGEVRLLRIWDIADATPGFRFSSEPYGAFRFRFRGGMSFNKYWEDSFPLTEITDAPHWFLILLFLVPWSAWLFWHWKREQKKSS